MAQKSNISLYLTMILIIVVCVWALTDVYKSYDEYDDISEYNTIEEIRGDKTQPPSSEQRRRSVERAIRSFLDEEGDNSFNTTGDTTNSMVVDSTTGNISTDIIGNNEVSTPDGNNDTIEESIENTIIHTPPPIRINEDIRIREEKLKENTKITPKDDVLLWWEDCTIYAAVAKYCYNFGYNGGKPDDAVSYVGSIIDHYNVAQYNHCWYLTQLGLSDNIWEYKELDTNSIMMLIDKRCKDAKTRKLPTP